MDNINHTYKYIVYTIYSTASYTYITSAVGFLGMDLVGPIMSKMRLQLRFIALEYLGRYIIGGPLRSLSVNTEHSILPKTLLLLLSSKLQPQNIQTML